MNDILAEFTGSFKYDRRLFAADIRVSSAYCNALFDAGILTRLESERIRNGLHSILKRADFDKNYFAELPSEDVHSFIEARLIQLVGESGRKLRVGRSRIDQSATAFRLWLREEISELSKLSKTLQSALIFSAENQKEAVLPGYIHLQRAQPILWAHWCLAYFEMLERDRERLDEVWRRVNVMPLGAATLAGTSFEIDREALARDLNFEGVAANSLDAVSDYDFAIEFVGACSLVMIHLSRIAADLILYATAEFGFIKLDVTITYHSILISKRMNLQALELIRGKAGRVFGHQNALQSMIKGLPLAYSSDVQETKEAVFDTVDTVSISLQSISAVLKNLHLDDVKSRAAAAMGYSNADELFDYLVQRNLPVKIAYEIVEQVVYYASLKNKELNELSLAEIQKFSETFEKDVFEVLSLEQKLAGKNQIGGTALERVYEALQLARESLEREET